jgi:hypothetical protein
MLSGKQILRFWIIHNLCWHIYVVCIACLSSSRFWEDDVTHLPYRQRFISVSVSSHYSYIPSNFSTLHSSYNNRRGNSRNTNSTYFVRWVTSTDFSRRIKYTTCLKNRKYTKSSCAWRKSWLCTCNKSSVKSPGHFANW